MALDPAERAALARLVLTRGYERRPEAFALSSGGSSHDYVDGKFAVAAGPTLVQVARALVAVAEVEFDAVGGPTMGADALAVAVAVVTGCAWFSVRKEPKGHGRGSWIEGARLGPGDRVLMVEDVVSTGASLLRAADRVGELGAEVVAASALLDRSPAVADRFAAAGVPWRPLLTWADLGIDPL
jgi:orotate phosphoribosyltransferase